MNGLIIAKFVISLVVSSSVGSLVGNVIKNNALTATANVSTFAAAVGGFIVSSMISDAAVDHVDSKIGKLIPAYAGKKEQPKTEE